MDLRVLTKRSMIGIAGILGLSACTYDDGYYGGGVSSYSSSYGCDPYGGYDSYYGCDYGQGFGNIGYGGGWYDNYYYPGHGLYLFDRGGGRYRMNDRYRRHWGRQRADWHRGRGHGGHRDRDHRRGYDGRRDGDRDYGRRDDWRRDGDRDYRGEGRRGYRERRDGDRYDGRRNWSGDRSPGTEQGRRWQRPAANPSATAPAQVEQQRNWRRDGVNRGGAYRGAAGGRDGDMQRRYRGDVNRGDVNRGAGGRRGGGGWQRPQSSAPAAPSTASPQVQQRQRPDMSGIGRMMRERGIGPQGGGVSQRAAPVQAGSSVPAARNWSVRDRNWRRDK